jgi:Carboxypeptidase regulatory-like domain/TonB dependent receptor/TonB-dependent Receptor Plug Domain
MFSPIHSEKFVVFLLGLVALVFLPLLSCPAYAQVTGATLSGTVRDQSGGVVPNAGISIKNVATGVTRAVKTDTAGFYSAPNLLPGNYDITATAPGFSSQAQNGVELTVGAQQVLNITMQVGQVTQSVQVTAEAPTVQLASSAISAVVSATTVRELPLNGRSWTDLAALQPGVSGVTAVQTDFSVGGDRGNRGFGNQISVAGDRPEQNNYRLDGVSINDFNNAAPGSVLGGDLGVDAVQEFSVLTSNVSAEYGRTSGGVINAVTRSGTNQFHGDAYEFLRNDAFDAPNFFDNAGGLKKGSFKQNQFGVSAGAPIRKDKTFIFGDYEGIRYSKGIPTSITVPSNAARLGNLCSAPDTGTCTANSVTVDPAAQKYLPIWPVSSQILPGSDGDIATFAFSAPRKITENFFTIRADDKLSQNDNLAATYLYDFTPYSSPDGLDAVLVSSNTHRQIVSLEETHTFGSALVNTARAGYSRLHELNDAGQTAINPLSSDPSLAAIPGQFAAHVLFPSLPDQFTGGVNGNTYVNYGWNSFQGYDDAFWTHGTHSFKFGGQVERMQLNRLSYTDPSGVFQFASLGDFLINNPKRFTGQDHSSVREAGLRQTIFGVYAQDDWRLRPNLTVNLGLRWEMGTVVNDNHGYIANLINFTDAAPHCGTFIAGCAPGGPLYGNSTRRNFEPRVGFAWDPFRNGKTAIRGSFGMFDILPMAYQYIVAGATAYPFQRSGSVNSSKKTPLMGTFPAGAFSLITPGKKGAYNVEQFAHRSYVMEWNLNVQREVVRNLTLMVGYVGSRGVHEPFRVDDADIVLPTKTSAGYLYPQVDGSGNQCLGSTATISCPANVLDSSGNPIPPSRINEGFGSIGFVHYEGNSFYNALETAVQKTMSHGVQFQTSFTWGKSIDTGSATGHGDQFTNSLSSMPFYDLKALRGRSDFDVKRTLVVSLTWQVPSPKSLSGAAGWVASGWELGGIFKANDGIPWTPTWASNGGDPQGLLNSDDWAFPNRLNTPGCATLTNPGNPNNYVKTQCFTVPSAPDLAYWNTNCDPNPLNAPANPDGSAFAAQFPQCFNLRGNAGRNIITGPGLMNLDFSVFKNNTIKRISESFNVQFRAEFFNVLNRANFANQSTALFRSDVFDVAGAPVPTAGVLTATATPAREIQFALKFLW